MTPCILMVIFIANMSHGYSITQTLFQNFYSNQLAIIVCEHTNETESFEDFRLYSVSGTIKSLLCQKKSPNCTDVFYQVSGKKVVFLLLNIGKEAEQLSYQCEFTLKIKDVFNTKYGTPTKLQPVQKESRRQTAMPPSPPPPPPPPPPLKMEVPLLMWILTGLLVLMLLYSGVVTCCCIRLMRSDQDSENPTYVEMKKVPLSQKNIYCN